MSAKFPQSYGGTRTPPPTGNTLLGKREQKSSDLDSPPHKRKRIEGDVTSTSSNADKALEKIDLTIYIKEMLKPSSLPAYKQELISIKRLEGDHLVANKLSDKLGRRDIQFYDLYKLGEPKNELAEVQQQYSSRENVYDAQIYEDIEVGDFNVVYNNQDVIVNSFGKSIKVSVLPAANGQVTRQVKEDISKCVVDVLA